MTAAQPTAAPAPIPWRVKVKTRGSTWFSPGLAEAQAVQLAAEVGRDVESKGDTPHLMAFPTRYGVHAVIRAREVVSIEVVGPRWDGIDDNGPAATTPDAPARPAEDLTAGGPPRPTPATVASRTHTPTSRGGRNR